MKKLLSVAVVVAIVVGGGAFYGGMKYAQGRNSRGNFTNLTAEQRQQFMANAGAGFRSGAGGQGMRGAGGGFTAGEILSNDSQSITIKMPDGGSRIVFYSDSTEISKQVAGSVSDLAVGKAVSISGSSNSDGSITAQSIQIRPALISR